MHMVRAKLISTEGPYLEAVIEVEGRRFCVMDEFSVAASAPKPGQEFELEFGQCLDDEEEWETIFSGNPEGHIKLEQIQGWRYRAFGKIIGVDPVVVDCGIFRVEDVVYSSDPRLIGEPVAFVISRLDAC